MTKSKLPKINYVGLKTSLRSTDTSWLFPRGDHPDKRTNKEWMFKMGFKMKGGE